LAGRIPTRLTQAAAGRRFGVTLGVAFLALAALFWWRWGVTPARVALAVGGLLIAAGIAAPAKLGPVERAWMALGAAISKVTTPVILGLTYIVVFGVLGLLMRATGRNPLARARGAPSFWVSREESPPGPLTRRF